MKLLLVVLSLTLCEAPARFDAWAQLNANSVQIPPGLHTVSQPAMIYRAPSTRSERLARLTPGTKVWVYHDLGPWLEVRPTEVPETGFLRKSAVLNAHTRERVAKRVRDRSSRGSVRPPGHRGKSLRGPRVEILHPRDGAMVRQRQPQILLKGRVTPPAARTSSLDVLFVIDVSGSTRKYAGLNFLTGLSPAEQQRGFISDAGHYSETDNSILGAAVGATRRLVTQLDPGASRVGIITFGGSARLVEPLTDDFGWLHLQLKEILRTGPHGGTHLADGLRMGIRELAGLGVSTPRRDATKIQMILTDGYPTLPSGGGRAATEADIDVAVKAAAIARKAGIKIHVFGLGQGAPTEPRAAVEIAAATGGTYTAVTRANDIFEVLEQSSTVGVTHIEIDNETTGEAASGITLASDGAFTSLVPVEPGMNRIAVRALTDSGKRGSARLLIHFEPTDSRSLEVDVFLGERHQSILQKLTQ